MSNTARRAPQELSLIHISFLGSFQPRLDFLNALRRLHGVHGVDVYKRQIQVCGNIPEGLRGSVGVHNHHHVKIAGHDCLGNVQDIDVVVRQSIRNCLTVFQDVYKRQQYGYSALSGEKN